MSEQINDGGQAFPVTFEQWDNDTERWRVCSDGGMTMRDYFAAKAMQALIARVPYGESHGINHEAISVAAYGWADAMLKERSA